MADNVILNPGEGGDTIGADDVGGVKYVVDKIAFGPDGSVTLVSLATGLPINLVKSVSEAVVTGSKTTTANTAVALVSSSTPTTRGIVIKSSNDNSLNVYVGPSTVTPGTTSATDGFELSAGESISIPIDDVSKVYINATSSSIKVFWTMV